MNRSRRLQRHATMALAATIPPSLFLAAMLLGSGGAWSPIATALTMAIAFLAVTSIACRYLAQHADRPTVVESDSPQGDSPEVTHPLAASSLTPVEVGK